jgi:hypothetical protein
VEVGKEGGGGRGVGKEGGGGREVIGREVFCLIKLFI